MDDLKTEQYERRPFTIFYFLSDDTIEIREQYHSDPNLFETLSRADL